MTGAPRRIAIAGDGGPIAWLTAMALKRAFAHLNLDVVIVEEGRAPTGAIATLPSLRALHALAGLDERALVQATGASFRLGSRHQDWNADGSDFLHLHGEIGSPLSGAPFHKYISFTRVQNRPESVEDFSLAAIAARNHRFARPRTDPASPFSSYNYGYHLDVAAYAEHVRGFAVKLGVRRQPGPIATLDLSPEGDIASLALPDGSRVSAELYIDCSGDRASLIGRMAASSFEDWSRWLPCDRSLSARVRSSDAAAPMTETMAAKAGWLWRIPLQDQAIVGHVYSTSFVNDDQAVRGLQETFPSAEIVALDGFRSGRRRAAWIGNCLAIGPSAVTIEPLAAAELHLAQVGITNLIALFPLSADMKMEAAEYDRLMAEYAVGVRDFTIAHYRAAPGTSGPFWSEIADNQLPDRLQYKLDLFAANGRIVMFDCETFEETDWAWLLLGRGVRPDAIEPQVRLILEQTPPAHLRQLAEHLRHAALSMPHQDEYIARANFRRAP